MRSLFACLVVSLIGVGSAAAFQNASDDASDPVYDNGWQNGDNGGSGWSGGWQLSSFVGTQGSAAGHAVASSTANGGGDVDTGGRSFHLSASGGGESGASRYFTSPLAVGEAVSADLDTGAVAGSPALFLLVGSGPARLVIGATSGTYYVTDLAGPHSTVVVVDGDPVSARVTLTGADSYSALLTPLVGAPVTISGTLKGSGSIDHVVFDVSQPGVATRDMYFNRVTLPEPTQTEIEAGALAPLGLLALRKRRGRRGAAPGA